MSGLRMDNRPAHLQDQPAADFDPWGNKNLGFDPPSRPTVRSNAVLVSASGVYVAITHTFLALGAFLAAALICSQYHFYKVVKNEYYGWPDEWLPSVSAVIGDWFFERNLFQLIIALTAGPRFVLVGLAYLNARLSWPKSTFASNCLLMAGLLRTLSAGGWMYITSSDHALTHDVCMVLYMVLTLPWHVLSLILTSNSNEGGYRLRQIVSGLFFMSIAPLVVFYIQHKNRKIPGAYSAYAIFEWCLIIFDILFDAVSITDFGQFELQIVHVGFGHAQNNFHLPGSPGTRKSAPLDPLRKLAWQKFAANPASLHQTITFISDTYLAFCFWTSITALLTQIFFFSTWQLGLAGHEALVLCVTSPILLASPDILQFAVNHQSFLSVLSLTGLAAPIMITSPLIRLLLLAFGIATHCLQLASSWWSGAGPAVMVPSGGLPFGLGLFATMAIKYANFSLNPVWSFINPFEEGYSIIGVVVGLIACAERFLRPTRPYELHSTASSGSAVLASLGLAGVLFGLHTLYSDSGTTIAWGFQGYPIVGPVADKHGWAIMAAAATGLSISTHKVLVASPWWTLLATAATYVLYAGRDWQGYAGALLLACYLYSMLPAFVAMMTQYHPAWFALSWLIYDLISLSHVFTVAYAFVPGGNIFRERVGSILAAMLICICCGLCNLYKIDKIPFTFSSASLKHLSVAARRVKISAITILVISIAIVVYRGGGELPVPHHSATRLFTAGIWTVHFGLDENCWDSQRRISKLAKLVELDVFGLLESDLHRNTMGNRDISQFIAHKLGYYVDIGPGPNKSTWGVALFSKFKIIKSTHHLLPSPYGELAPAIYATLDVFGTLVDVLVSHNGQEETPLDRQLQSLELSRLMRESYPRPLVLLSYVVTKPHAPRPDPYRYLAEDGLVSDVDPYDLDRWCEYIMYRGLDRVAYARISRGIPAVTDTELQVAKFVVPKEPFDSPESDRFNYKRVTEILTPAAYRFPDVLKGEGVEGHYFHVHKEGALYYGNPPDCVQQ